MRLKNYINENRLPQSPQEAANFIKENCQPFLKESKGKYFYRGMFEHKSFLIKYPRKDRKPTDMSPTLSILIDDILQKKIGWRPRSHGIFASGDTMTAAAYGTAMYIIFPIGPFKYVWFKHVQDTIRFQNEFFDLLRDREPYDSMKALDWHVVKKDLKTGTYYTSDPKEMNVFRDVLKELFRDYRPRTNYLRSVYKAEVTFLCKSYFAVHHTHLVNVKELLK